MKTLTAATILAITGCAAVQPDTGTTFDVTSGRFEFPAGQACNASFVMYTVDGKVSRWRALTGSADIEISAPIEPPD